MTQSLRVGLTYDLRDEYLAAGYSEEETAEFDRAETIDALEQALQALGHRPDRIGNARQLVQRVAVGERWDLVFNICEGLRGMGREAQAPAILDLFQIPYTFSDPCVLSICLHKGLTKALMRDAGVPTATFQVVENEGGLDQAASFNLYPAFVKPVGEGTGKGVSPASRVEDASQLVAACRELLRRFRQPVLVEEYLPGREFTVGILGAGGGSYSMGVMEVLLLPGAEPGVYSYENKEKSEDLVTYRIASTDGDRQARQAEQIALSAWRRLGCLDGGRVDLRCDRQGRPQFLEVNPLAGLHPTHSDLPMLAQAAGMSYLELIKRIVDLAAARATL